MTHTNASGLDGRLARMEAAAERGEAYLPHKDSSHPRSIAGELLSRSIEDAGYGEREVLKVLDAKSGKVWRLYCQASILADEVARQNPQPGDLVLAKYGGKVPNRAGTAEYHSWTLVVDKSGSITSGEASELADPPEPALSVAERAAEAYGDDPAF